MTEQPCPCAIGDLLVQAFTAALERIVKGDHSACARFGLVRAKRNWGKHARSCSACLQKWEAYA